MSIRESSANHSSQFRTQSFKCMPKLSDGPDGLREMQTINFIHVCRHVTSLFEGAPFGHALLKCVMRLELKLQRGEQFVDGVHLDVSLRHSYACPPLSSSSLQKP